MIETGASASRIHPAFADAIEQATTEARRSSPHCSIYLYGSVATGMATVGTSDLDLLTIGLDQHLAAEISTRLSAEHERLVRRVDLASAPPRDVDGSGDEAYGFRVFLRHYCVHLAGADLRPAHDFPADARAARGFNGDIAQHRDRWRSELTGGDTPADLGTRVARKTLLALAGIVSVHDALWTTDRARAAERWAEIAPDTRSDLEQLLAWCEHGALPSTREVERALRQTVDPIVERFAADIGLWTTQGV